MVGEAQGSMDRVGCAPFVGAAKEGNSPALQILVK